MAKPLVIIPTASAGGTAYWSKRMNWYSESDPMKPNRYAALTITIPSRGNNIYRIAIIPIMSETPTPDLFKPETTTQIMMIRDPKMIRPTQHKYDYQSTWKKICSNYQSHCWDCCLPAAQIHFQNQSLLKLKLISIWVSMILTPPMLQNCRVLEEEHSHQQLLS